LFGLEENRTWSTTRTAPKTLGGTAKKDALYRVNRTLQWKLAEKYVKERNPNGELIWVDKDGKFNRFRVNEGDKKERAPRKLLAEFEEEAIKKGLLPNRLLLNRVKDNNAMYTDDDVDCLMDIYLPSNTHYISPALALVNQAAVDPDFNTINDQ